MNFGLVRKIVHLFKTEYAPYRWHILLLGVLSFFGGIMEGFGVTAIIPVFSFVNEGRAGTTDAISQFIENFFVYFHLPYTLKFLLLLILGLFVFKAILVFAVSQVSALITTSYERNTSSSIFHLTLLSTWKSLSNHKVGYLSQIINNDVLNSSALLTYISMFLITAINLLIYTLLVFNISPVIAGLTVAFGAAVFLCFKPLLYKNKVLAQAVVKLYKDTAHYLEEVVIGIKAIKAMSLERRAGERGESYFEQTKIMTRRMATFKNITNAILQPLGLLLVLAIFAYFYKFAGFNFASFAVIVYSINKVFANVQIAQIQLHKFSSTAPYLASIIKYKHEALQAQEENAGAKPFRFSTSLQFDNVSFAYREDQPVLTGVSFTIDRGVMTGIIGPSGSGKTTITDLILRLFQPQQGRLTLDGESIDTIRLSDWRTKIGYVSQDAFLINDTIENNIKFYSQSVTGAAALEAAKMANIEEFVNGLPEKFNTVVGERGVKLSGGQRQRIILARVLARKPEILILDEATSSLDSESEASIQGTINGLKDTMTVVIIAHRLSTVMAASKLVVIENGKILEQGTPQELLRNTASYLSRVYNLR